MNSYDKRAPTIEQVILLRSMLIEFKSSEWSALTLACQVGLCNKGSILEKMVCRPN